MIFDGDDPGFSLWNARRYALCLKGVAVPVCAIAAVAQLHCALGRSLSSAAAGVVANLDRGHEEAERSAFCIGDGVQLRIHTFGATDEAPKAPF